MIPAKIDPNSYIQDDSLFTLNKFRDYLLTLSSKQAKDALKVIDCLRFIKINPEFISYAFKNRNDMGIYTFERDKQLGVIRDQNNTSFHVDLYNDPNKNPDECLKTYLMELKETIKQMEDAINVVTEHDKQREFTDKFFYDDTVGCLAQRSLVAVVYAKELETAVEAGVGKPIYFEDLMNELAKKFSDDEEKNYLLAYEFFAPYIGKKVRYKKLDDEVKLDPKKIDHKLVEVNLDYGFITHYMCDVLLHNPPRQPSGQHFYDEYQQQQAAQETLKLIHGERALIKIVHSELANNVDMEFMIKQLKDPANFRPVKKLGDSKDRTRVYDPKEKKDKIRQVSASRGASKPAGWKYTKKSPTTLLPTNAKINFYKTGETEVGLLWDIDLCSLKEEKYTWLQNVRSNYRWWVGNDYTGKVPSVGLAGIREFLREHVSKGNITYHNEILACLCKEGLHSIFASVDSPEARLNALRTKHMFKDILGVDLPILIITPTQGAKIYSKAQIVSDIESALKKPNSNEFKIVSTIAADAPTVGNQLKPNDLLEYYELKSDANKQLRLYKDHVNKKFNKHIEDNQFKEALEILNNKNEAFAIENKEEFKYILELIELLSAEGKDDIVKKFLKTGDIDISFKELLIDFIDNDRRKLLIAVLKKPLPSDVLSQALYHALATNKKEMALQILEHQFLADYTDPISKNQAIHLALRENDIQLVLKLLQRNASITSKNAEGKTALDMMLMKSPPDTIKMLEAVMADNNKIYTVLDVLSKARPEESVIKYLLEKFDYLLSVLRTLGTNKEYVYKLVNLTICNGKPDLLQNLLERLRILYSDTKSREDYFDLLLNAIAYATELKKEDFREIIFSKIIEQFNSARSSDLIFLLGKSYSKFIPQIITAGIKSKNYEFVGKVFNLYDQLNPDRYAIQSDSNNPLRFLYDIKITSSERLAALIAILEVSPDPSRILEAYIEYHRSNSVDTAEILNLFDKYEIFLKEIFKQPESAYVIERMFFRYGDNNQQIIILKLLDFLNNIEVTPTSPPGLYSPFKLYSYNYYNKKGIEPLPPLEYLIQNVRMPVQMITHISQSKSPPSMKVVIDSLQIAKNKRHFTPEYGDAIAITLTKVLENSASVPVNKLIASLEEYMEKYILEQEASSRSDPESLKIKISAVQKKIAQLQGEKTQFTTEEMDVLKYTPVGKIIQQYKDALREIDSRPLSHYLKFIPKEKINDFWEAIENTLPLMVKTSKDVAATLKLMPENLKDTFLNHLDGEVLDDIVRVGKVTSWRDASKIKDVLPDLSDSQINMVLDKIVENLSAREKKSWLNTARIETLEAINKIGEDMAVKLAQDQSISSDKSKKEVADHKHAKVDFLLYVDTLLKTFLKNFDHAENQKSLLQNLFNKINTVYQETLNIKHIGTYTKMFNSASGTSKFLKGMLDEISKIRDVFPEYQQKIIEPLAEEKTKEPKSQQIIEPVAEEKTKEPKPSIVYEKEKLLADIKGQLAALVTKDESYTSLANQITQGLGDLEKFDPNEKNNKIVENFRKDMQGLLSSTTGKENNPLLANPEFQNIAYNALIAAAVVAPLNNENQDPISMNDFTDIPADSLIYLSDGYFFEIPTLVQWIKDRGIMENPAMRGELHENDKLALINAAEKLQIDLKNLDRTKFKVEEDPSMLAAAIQIALGPEPQPSAASTGQALQHFGHFQAASPFMQDIANATGKPADYWIRYQSEHPYRFNNVVSAAPYIKQGVLTVDQAIALSPKQVDSLVVLTMAGLNLTPAELREQVNAILNPPSGLRRP